MPIPTNISNILNKNIVERVRVECKNGWNPNDIIHTICAFANDIDNFSGGYIIVGAAFNENTDQYDFRDLSNKEIDEIQKELTEYCLKCIYPQYVPVSDVVEHEGHRIIVIWAYAGTDRPYSASEDVSNLKTKKSYYIRKGSTTIRAIGNLEKELLRLGEKEPFDDRLNYHATLDDIDIELIKQYLARINSGLLPLLSSATKEELCNKLRIIGGPKEDLRPRNIALLMFSLHPEDYIPYSYIDLVIIKDPTGRNLIEKRFSGSLINQYDSVMNYLENNIIEKKIIKSVNQTVSKVVYNYPLEALDEIIANAILHKDYQEKDPITIRIENDNISVTSYPGFDSSIRDKDVKRYEIRSERYRNRRIAEILKELHIVEAHNTGYPTILEACDENDSDYPLLISDDDRTYLTVKLKIASDFIESSAQRDVETEIINLLHNGGLSLTQISRALGYSEIPGSLKRTLKILIANEVIEVVDKKYYLKLAQK